MRLGWGGHDLNTGQSAKAEKDFSIGCTVISPQAGQSEDQILAGGRVLLSSLEHHDWLWAHPALCSVGYRDFFSLG
jgi:hypothetical protein